MSICGYVELNLVLNIKYVILHRLSKNVLLFYCTYVVPFWPLPDSEILLSQSVLDPLCADKGEYQNCQSKFHLQLNMEL